MRLSIALMHLSVITDQQSGINVADINISTAAVVITIEDDDDDPISEMKLHLHESYIATGFQKSIEVVDVLDSPSYSPTQSPDRLSPIYLPPDCDFSPPDSPSDCQVVEDSPQPPPLPLSLLQEAESPEPAGG